MEWSSYASLVVNQILSPGDLEKWTARYLMLKVKLHFDRLDKTLTWNSRSSTALANIMARESFKLGTCFDLSDVANLPNCFLDIGLIV